MSSTDFLPEAARADVSDLPREAERNLQQGWLLDQHSLSPARSDPVERASNAEQATR